MSALMGHAGWGYDPDTDKEYHDILVRYEDSFTKDGTERYCRYCEGIFNPDEMTDYPEAGFIFKVCKECSQ